MHSPPFPTDTLINERVLAATPSEVFSAFEDPAVLAQWWGPEGFTNTFELFEFKPGGRWIFTMHAPNGAKYANESFFRDLEPGRKVVIEHVVQPWFRLTITLSPHGTQTHLHWAQQFESPEIAEKMRPLSKSANEENLDRLEKALASRKD